jgi:hypothetical protein
LRICDVRDKKRGIRYGERGAGKVRIGGCCKSFVGQRRIGWYDV